MCQVIKDAIEKEMTYASFRYNDGYTGNDMYKGRIGYQGTTSSDLSKDVGLERTNLSWCPDTWIYDSFYRASMGEYTDTQLATLYQLVYHTVFKTNATITFDSSTDKFNIAIAAVQPSFWDVLEIQYPVLNDFRFRTLVLMPGSTLLTRMGYNDSTLATESTTTDFMYNIPDNERFYVVPSDKYNYHVGYDGTDLHHSSNGHVGVIDPWSLNIDDKTVLSATSDDVVAYEYSRALHIRTNLTNKDMIDSYHGRLTNAMCVVPIHADAGEIIYSRLDESIETSQITQPTVNQITVTITDEHGNVIETNSEVNMVLQFQYYKIPVLHKPIQDVRNRLRYLRELMTNKNKLATTNNAQKKRKVKKKEKGEAKAKPDSAGNSVRPRPTTAPKAQGAQP